MPCRFRNLITVSGTIPVSQSFKSILTVRHWDPGNKLRKTNIVKFNFVNKKYWHLLFAVGGISNRITVSKSEENNM